MASFAAANLKPGQTVSVTASSLSGTAATASNVDLTAELTEMQTAEQAYDMGSKAVQMEAELGQIAATLK